MIFLSFILIFFAWSPLLKGDCIRMLFNNTNDCFACSYSFYNKNYLFPDSDQIECFPRFNETYVRKIIIRESKCENCTEIYDKVYYNITEAFYLESEIIMKYQYSNVTFYFDDGHYTIDNAQPQNYFRQSLADITLISINYRRAYLNFKGKYCSLYVSKSLKIIDINIVGDLFPNNSTKSNENLYALINIEKQIDYEKEDPFLVILNCLIIGFQDYDILINLMFPFGSIFLENLEISDNSFSLISMHYFPNNVIFDYCIKDIKNNEECYSDFVEINGISLFFVKNVSIFHIENITLVSIQTLNSIFLIQIISSFDISHFYLSNSATPIFINLITLFFRSHL